MSRRAGLLSLLLSTSLFGAHVEPGERYEYYHGDALTLIAPKAYRTEAPAIAAGEEAVLRKYAESYGYRLDSRLFLMLASPKNQIANAFSTQIPFNMQVDYIAGALYPDYFASISWYRMLLLHESAHNYQLNAKKNPLSRISHRIVGNTPVTWLLFAPLFPLPNLTESSFMLEGNAVLNESLYGNGGRLFSGAFWAMTLLQAKAGYVTPQRVYNDHLYFPYGTHHYIVGGFFQLYLARRYGVERTNRYFSAYSEQWLPFFTNAVFRKHFGKSFETLLGEYNSWLLKEARGFRESEGEVVAFSQQNVPLGSDSAEIFFLTSDARHAPQLVRLEKRSGRHTSESTSHLLGRLFHVGRNYYSLASGRIANDRVAVALYDREGRVVEGTQGRAMQCITPSGKRLWFEIAESYDSPHLYRDGASLGRVNSSVRCDSRGNYYYFRQEGGRRTLYRGEEALYTYAGYYGRVADVGRGGEVLFVANSPKGSTLYRLDRAGAVTRVCEGDDILDARLIDDDTVLAEVIQSDGVAFMKLALHPIPASPCVAEVLPQRTLKTEEPASSMAAPQKYKPLQNLRYSALDQFFALRDDGGSDFSLEARFSDPLERNHLRLFLSDIAHETRVGIGYDNSAHKVTFGGDIYTSQGNDANRSSRGYGLDGYVAYPFYRQTWRSGDLRLEGHLDRKRGARSPLALTLTLQDRKKFGMEFYPNSLDRFSLFALTDRGDGSCGAGYSLVRDLGSGFYGMGGVRYLRSDTKEAGREEHGVWIDESGIAAFSDPSRLFLPSLPCDLYAKEAFAARVKVAKMFSFGRYYFSLPLSLRQESLYTGWRYMHLKDVMGGGDRVLQEVSVGMRAELLLLHKLVLPVTFEWMYNDRIAKSRNFRFVIDMHF